MKKLLILLLIASFAFSCTITIPMQTNLSDQTLLLAENRNIKVDYVVNSNVKDGFINYTYVYKNGTETPNNDWLKYPMETAFKKFCGNFFSAKFNDFAEDQMHVELTLLDFEFRDQQTMGMGMTLLTGATENSMIANATIDAIVIYHGKTYHNELKASTSEYNQSQSMSAGGSYYTINQKNPTQQKSELIDACLNSGIVQFENFLRSVIMADKD